MSTELIKLGASIAGELIMALVDAFTKGEDIEPLISNLPPETQKNIRRHLEDAETKKQLQAIRDQYTNTD